MVQSLLFIENRDLLDHERPYLNPAVDWGRFAQAALSQVGKMLGFSAHSSGGSTLATQIEIPPLCRRAHRQHRRQAAADALGQRTQLSRRPGQLRRAPGHRAHLPQLGAAVGGAGLAVTGLADGLWVWYGADYRQVGGALDSKAGLAAQGLALRQVLALMIAHRRPSFYLAPRGLTSWTG